MPTAAELTAARDEIFELLQDPLEYDRGGLWDRLINGCEQTSRASLAKRFCDLRRQFGGRAQLTGSERVRLKAAVSAIPDGLAIRLTTG